MISMKQRWINRINDDTLLPAVALATSLLLSACGGGDSDGNAPAGNFVRDDAPVTTLPATIATRGASRWSDPATWGGAIPQDGSNVIIPSGRTIILDQDVIATSITVNGELICGDQNLNVRARWIMVHGLLQCGTDTAPYVHRLDITLIGNNRNETIMGMGTKMISAMGGGVISLHGEERTSWLMLDGTVNPGAQKIHVEYATNWRAGDEIVIASTDDDMEHAEVRRIDRVNGAELVLSEKLDYRHFGEVQSFANASRNWDVDTRAEVGLLTRNIRIQGDNSSASSRFGAHMMIMPGSAGLVSGVEFLRVGQEGMMGRYPFHWHLANDVVGQYIRNSSIRQSYNRCVTVHASHNAVVEDNVCYDHIGHGYFLQDGGETGNLFKHNLGLVTRKPQEELALIPSDIQEGQASRGPSTYWISNPDNTFIGNAAAGSEGLGFWYDTGEKVTGESEDFPQYQGVSPMRAAFGEFRDNRVHSSDMAFSTCTFESGPAGYLPPERAEYKNLTVFAGGDGAVWPCEGNQIFTDLKVTDTGHSHHSGFVAPRPVTVRDSLFVANSKLSADGRGRQRSAIGIYDFGVDLRNVHFVNFNNEYGGSYLFGARDADVRITSNPISGVTLADSYLYYDRRGSAESMRPSAWGAVIHDEDGSLGLGAGTALVADHPMMTDSTCTDVYGTGRLCGNRYGRVELDFAGKKNLPAMTHSRSDGRTATIAPLAARAHYQSVVSVNHGRYHYAYEFAADAISAKSLIVGLDFLHNGDTVVLEFKNLPGNASVSGAGYSAAFTLADLKNGDGKRFFREGSSLYLKLRATGTIWQASDLVQINW